jgi:hypothetical protein
VDSLLATLGEFLSAWQSYEAEAGEFIDAGENVVNVSTKRLVRAISSSSATSSRSGPSGTG